MKTTSKRRVLISSVAMLLVAMLAQTMVVIAVNVIVINQRSAAFAGAAVIFHAVSADNFALNKAEIIIRDDSSAMRTELVVFLDLHIFLFHFDFPP